MHAGTIEWNGADLSRIGRAKLGIRRSADPPAPAAATRMLVELTVTVDLEAGDPGTVTARAEWLAASMRVGEGILACAGGSGITLEWLAVPGDNNLQEVLAGSTNSVVMSFSAVENHPSLEHLTGATFTPAGSATPLHLHAVRDFKEEIRTARHSERAAARSLTTTTLSFTARVAQANTADGQAVRLAWLQAKAAEVKALDTREGTLVMAGVNAIVRVTEFTPRIDERAGVLDVDVQCYHVMLPDNGKAECLYDVDVRIEEGSGEEVISYKGEIAAATRDIAMAKLAALRQAQLVPGQRVAGYSTQDKTIDGADSHEIDGADWTGALSFTLEIRKARPAGQHTLRISTRKDIRNGMRWTYSGSVMGPDEVAALQTARAIAAAANHPVLVSSEETLDKATDLENPATLHLIKLDFNYEFEGPSDGFISGELTTEISKPMAGEWRSSTSGYLIAATKSAAENRLDQLLAGLGQALEQSRKWSEVYLDPDGSQAAVKQVAMRLDFSHSTRMTRSRMAAEYTDTTQNSIASMTQTRSVTGTVWASSESTANSELDQLLKDIYGTNGPQEITRTHSRLKYDGTGATTEWIKLDFSASSVTRLTGVTGYDLLEATMTISRDGSINQAIITPIPFERPVAQPNIGWIPGRISITATAKAVNLNTARLWVQNQRGLISSIGSAGTTRFETDQPRESASPEYAPFEGGTPKLWSFSGTYGWTFTDTHLDGVWSNQNMDLEP